MYLFLFCCCFDNKLNLTTRYLCLYTTIRAAWRSMALLKFLPSRKYLGFLFVFDLVSSMQFYFFNQLSLQFIVLQDQNSSIMVLLTTTLTLKTAFPPNKPCTNPKTSPLKFAVTYCSKKGSTRLNSRTFVLLEKTTRMWDIVCWWGLTKFLYGKVKLSVQ